MARGDVPEHLRDTYDDDINDLTPEVLANLELLGERPGHVTIIGVVPADLSLGTELSAAGREGMAKSIDFILDDLAAIGVRLTSEPLAATGTD